MMEAITKTQAGVPADDVDLGFEPGVVVFLGYKGVGGKEDEPVEDVVITGGKVGDWVPKVDPQVISGHRGTTEAHPVLYKYASQSHPMSKYLHFKNVPINSIRKKNYSPM